ncbi:hypothetical protein [uncultured Desulfovibrio sp.]|uniref:hypothetical protein n=1 Tax=uncultured Desulfovibrio sp. TaxID=167968 RepID=UPI0026201014|nr:hypothetical protein [uncultured Desulfovibrio sp.]
MYYVKYYIKDICSEVFATVKQVSYPRNNRTKCVLSGDPISYGDPVYLVKLVTHSDGDALYVRVDKAEEHPEFMRNLGYFEQRIYPCSFMFYDNFKKMEPFDPDWVGKEGNIRQLTDAIAEAKSEKQRRNLQAELDKLGPNHPPLSCEEVLERFLDRLKELKTGARPVDLGQTKWLWNALEPLVMSELHVTLVERYASLPAELRVALACSDNPVFVRLAMESGLLPDWERIRTLMGKGRLALADMLTFAEWGRAHPDGLKLLWSTHTLFGILGFSAGGSLGFGEMLENGHAGYLLFLFTAHPELAPMLSAFDPANPYYGKGQAADQELRSLVESYCYQLVYIYRAGVFAALLAGDPDEARKWVALMRKNAGYYFHGSPDGFINATEKMAEQYIRKHLK